MKISSIKVKLKDEDIFQAIQEYVKVDNFKVNSLTFNDTINISCTFKKKISIPIKLKVRIYEVEKNVLFLSIADLNLAKIHIFSGIISFGLKKALKDFKDQGIYIDKDIISIDMNVVGNKIPSAKFELVNLCTEKGYLEAEVKDLQITKPKEKE